MIISDFFTHTVKKSIAPVFACAVLVFLPAHLFAQTKAIGLDLAISEAVDYLRSKSADLATFDIYIEGKPGVAFDGFVTPTSALSNYIKRRLENGSHEFFNVVEISSQNLKLLQDEINLALEGVTSEGSGELEGHWHGANFFVLVEVVQEGADYLFNLRIIRTRTRVLAGSFQRTISGNDGRLQGLLHTIHLSLGGRAGMALNMWTLSNDITGSPDSPSLSFEPALQVAVHVNRFFALQTELALAMDTVSYSGDDVEKGAYTASFTAYSLRIPLIARFTYTPRTIEALSLAGFVGIGFNIPVGALQVQSNLYPDSAYRFSLPPSYIVGANVGWQVGPGIVFADIRFSGDLARTVIIDNADRLAVYLRNTLSFALGYEYKFRWRN